MLPRKLQYSVALLALLVLCVCGENVRESLSCFRCYDEYCEDQISQECATLGESNQCFMRFDPETTDVVEMGCLSDYEDEDEIIALVKQKVLLTCKGSNCNGFQNLPNANECTQCTSANLEACATKPTTLTSKANCRAMPYTQCYQRVNGEVTERDCLSELVGDEFYNCLTGTDEKCKICEDNGCNDEIIPSNRLRCHRCTTETDLTCDIAPAASSVCPSYNENDGCAASYENGITKRGCASEFSCDANSKSCQVCSSDNCNIANIKKRVEEVYGIFQGLPINCNTCSENECQNGLRNPQKCEGDIFQDCMTVFTEQGQVIRRGCENRVMTDYETYCATNSDLCFNCKSNGCNDMTDFKAYQECLYCDAAANPECLFNPSAVTTTRKCALGCVSSLYPRKSDSSVFDFVRSCFEDIESDNRDNCTEANNCVKCSTDKCNNIVLPQQNRLSCYHCEGSDCAEPKSQVCVGYAPDDQCYIYFDNVTYSVMKMGCRSEYSKEAILADIKQYFICDGDNCNIYSNLPEANICYVCDSDSDVNCAVAPTQVTSQGRCQNFPYTQCFTRIQYDGRTERGCLYNLPIDVFKTCHDGHGDSKCRICAESGCNKNVYPSDRQRCFRCDSSTDANCESAPTELQACPIFNEEDACVTRYADGKTLRACASEITCQGLSRKNCRTCPYSGCNNVNLAEEDIGEVGVFTGLPLTCYHCNGTEDCQASNGYLNVCQNNNKQTCTVAFSNNGSVIGRGCSDALEHMCEGEGNLCYDCKSNGCNVAKSEADYVDCIYCDAKNGDNCTFNVQAITHTRKCYKSCMTALYPRTNDEEPVYETMRTCLDDKNLDERRSCEASTDAKCKSCTSANCNKDSLGVRKTCYQCQGDDCQDPKPQTCRAVMDNDQCFMQWDEAASLIAMGCKSQYDPDDVLTLVSAKFLWLCDADNCNTFDNLPEPQICSLCSSLTDSQCATNPANVQSTTKCGSVPYCQCYSRILKNGYTERGCLSNLEDFDFLHCLHNKNATECQSCLGDNCNNKVYPSDRTSCHVCSSVSSGSCETSPSSSEICLLYSSEEKCMTSIDSEGNTLRGCSSQINCDTSDSTSCQPCQGNDCNVVNLKRKSDGKPGQWQQLPLTCLSCKSIEDCKSATTQESCSGTEYCMTVFDVNGDIKRRGCSDVVEGVDSSYCDINSGKCLNCNSNLCNNALSLSNYTECVYCDSETNSECALNPSAVGRRRQCNGQCMSALYPIGNGSSVYEVVRSCMDDKDEADQKVCLSGSSDECKACSESSCNVHMIPESRLSCFSCSGSGCESAEPSQCVKFKLDDQCFILFDNKSDIVQMGCVSELEDSFVSDNIHRMYVCGAGNDCNSFENMPQPTQCLVCNSTDDPDCASLPQHVPGVSSCTALPNTQCYTKVNADGSTDRGCVNSLNQTQILSCLSGKSSECSSCDWDRCNIEIFPDDRRTCHRCNTKEDPNCEASPTAASVCPVYSATQFCASKLVNGHTYRGCSTEFQCDDSDKQYCRLCHDLDNCNTVDLASANIGYPGKWQGVPINCYSCQGLDCQASNLGNVDKCENNTQQNCATVFAQNGTVVERGCSDQIYNGDNFDFCDKNPGLCIFCKSNGCNVATSLTDYLDCLSCDGTENSNCIFNPENINRTRKCYKGCMTGLYARNDESNPAFEMNRGCADDMDLDDRTKCQEGSSPYCQACGTNSCNIVKIPITRLKCNICSGVDCADPESAECTSFRENDQCFTLFDGANDVQRMGCASDFDTSYLVNNRRQLLLCNGDNCNNFENLPKSTACRWCNSKDDPDCASSPTLSAATVCNRMPHTECSTYVDKEGTTYRGCLSDIDDNLFDECLNGSGNTCDVCNENNCNNKIFPEDRRTCIQCDSSLFSACEDNPSQFARTCSIYDEKDGCVTKLEGERTIRGCTSEITCDTSNRDTCRICNGTNNCNTINLLAVAIGYPGKWQGLPLTCYNCDGADCVNGYGQLNVCEGNNLQTCTTVFGSNGAVEKRSCSDAVAISHGKYCDDFPDHCPSCKSVGCNTAQSLEEYKDCYYCDSADSARCSINFDSTKARTRKCQGGCMVALYPRTSSNNSAYELDRNCLNDMNLDDRNDCLEGKNELCKACTEALCNTMNVPEERFECYKCLDEDCEEMAIRQCSAYHAQDQCYTLFNNDSSIIAMGCRSEYEMDAITELVKQKQMLLCNTKACNSPETLPTPNMCSVCDSEENPQCATNPNLVANIERCSSLPYSDCYTRINRYGHTERNCLAGLDSETFYGCITGTDDLCQTCVGDKCNEIDVFPSERLKCHQCSSATDPLCAAAPNNNKVCSIYNVSDTCVTNFRNGITTRGCSSAMTCNDESNRRTCRVCDSNGCNTVNLEKSNEDGEPGRWQSTPISCYSCEGEKDCGGQADLRVCVNNPYQNCMTIFSDEGKVIQRGCSDAVDEGRVSYCETNPDKCFRCNSNGCNIAKDLGEYVECLSCDTESNGDCLNNAAVISKTRKCYKNCMTAMYPLHKEDNPSYGLSRSCLDNMEFDDRESCSAGKMEYCKACNGPKCNDVAIPDKRISCFICEGDSCQNPQAQQCPTYRIDDKCYVRFDEKLSVIALGCRSEFSNQEADYLLQQKSLYICDGENCNQIEQLPTSQSCALCNSRTDSDCAVNPSAATGQTTCAVPPYTYCYSRVLSDGATERGCLCNLYDDEFVSCLNGTSQTCQSCKGNNCNREVFPESRLKCHICDSSIDPNCEDSPNSLSTCPLYNADDTCVTAIRNDITYRGCSSSLFCDDANPRKCVKCSGEGCNTVNLAKSQDDNYGKWQDLPLTCLSCKDSNCDSSESTNSTVCELNNEQDCMTVFNANGKVIRRGCADVVVKEYGAICNSEASCYSCKSNKCNTAKSKSEYVECVYCDTNKNLECLWNPTSTTHKTRDCQGGCMTALYPSDSSTTPGYDLIRTCLNDKEQNDQTSCNGGSAANCKSCAANKCNTDIVPDNRLRCFTCEGPTCEEPESKLCPLYKDNDQCYIKFDDSNSVSEMGCISSFRNQQLENIIKTKRVSVCMGDNCNTLNSLPVAQKCAVCSSADDVTCAVQPIGIGKFDMCSKFPYTGCFSKLTEDGTTQRGCLTDLPEDDFSACVLSTDDNCGICSGEGCNREIFPTDRQQCFTCNSAEESSCESYPESQMACPIVSDTEACITALVGNVTFRGCSSTLDCNISDSATCRSCFGSECNAIDLRNKIDDGYHGAWQDLPLRCHTCMAEQCLFSLGPAVSCSSRNIKQDCMTVFKSNGQVDFRGCSDYVDDYRDLFCRKNPHLCFKCKSNECNVAWSISKYIQCAFCNSSTDPMCVLNPETHEFSSRNCYKKCMVAMKDQQVIRSCLDDKELRMQHTCEAANGIECATCMEGNCNKSPFPADRLKCHVCTGDSCISSTSQYCELYDTSDNCFAKFENGKVDRMGCISAQNVSEIAEWETQKKLFKCKDNDCNEPSRLPAGGVCIACDSSKTLNCAQNPSLVTVTETCLAPNEECVTRINAQGHTIRGCLSNLNQSEQSCQADGTCSVCTGSKCNDKVYPADRRSCHICNSVAEKECIAKPNNPHICPIYLSSDSCVASLSDKGVITRGCASEISCDKEDKNYCQRCNSNNCNTAELKGSAGVASSSLMLTLSLAYAAIHLLNRR